MHEVLGTQQSEADVGDRNATYTSKLHAPSRGMASCSAGMGRFMYGYELAVQNCSSLRGRAVHPHMRVHASQRRATTCCPTGMAVFLCSGRQQWGTGP